MRRRRTHICEIMVIMLVIISLFTYPQSIQAKSNNAQIKKLVGKMESYAWLCSAAFCQHVRSAGAFAIFVPAALKLIGCCGTAP